MGHGVRILFEPLGRRGEAEPGESILDVARRLGIGLRSECGGTRACGKCRVVIEEQGGITKADESEAKRFTADERARSYRLACTTRILQSAHRVTVIVPPESVQRSRRFSEESGKRRVRLDPLVRRYPSGAGSQAARTLPDDGGVIHVEGGSRLLGVAVDVGTSRITARLIDLDDGSTISTESSENPQIVYGENLITRAAHAQRSDGDRLRLRAVIVDGVNALVTRMLVASGVARDDVSHAVIVGNTVMHHLLLGIDTSRLTRAPFTPAEKNMIQLSGAEFGFTVNPRGVVTLLPNVDAFVGADAVADMISSGLRRRAEPTLLLDIGTNTELMLRAGGETLACSCASGPAFEGEHIEHGMKAVDGAIESVRIRGGAVTYRTVGGAEPIGLCGSGMVDAVAELLRAGFINGVGRFSEAATPRLIRVGNQKKFTVAPAAESGTGSDITISEADINEIILAKAAISAAAGVLMGMKGVEASDLRHVLVAGAFGGHLDKANAEAIGLLPKVEGRRIVFLGNAALEGASMALMSRRILRQAREIAEETRYVELASNPDFDARFRKSLRLP